MSETELTENPILTPRLHHICDAYRKVSNVRDEFSEYSSLDYRPDSGNAGKKISDLMQEYSSAQKQLLLELVDFEKAVLHASIPKGRSISTTVVQRFVPFKIATAIVTGTGIENHYYGIVASEDKGNVKSPIHDVITVVIINGRSWRTFEVALDVMQFWELFLRYQTKLECRDFSRWVRKSLSGRVTKTVFDEGVTRCIPERQQVPAKGKRTIEALTNDIKERLKVVAAHLDELEIRKQAFGGFVVADSEPASPRAQGLKRAVRLYYDEINLLLSELVHLRDNVKKHLRAFMGTAEDLKTIEELKLYRVASRYVNTRKHGISGRNKSSAFAVLDYVVAARDGIEMKPTDPLKGVGFFINYDGEAWNPIELIEDLVQAWELFLRNHASIDTLEFRVEIGRRLLQRSQLSEYSAPLPADLESILKERAEDCSQLDIS